jgi:putative Holliday junction resolvase
MKTLAIDFGERRVGLAISDPSGSLALPLDTLERINDAETIDRIADLARAEEVERIVIGEPRALDGSRGSAARRIAGFAAKLGRRSGLPVVLRDEALTTHQARERLRAAGIDPRRHPGRLDAIAAQVLLEEFLGDPTRGESP